MVLHQQQQDSVPESSPAYLRIQKSLTGGTLFVCPPIHKQLAPDLVIYMGSPPPNNSMLRLATVGQIQFAEEKVEADFYLTWDERRISNGFGLDGVFTDSSGLSSYQGFLLHGLIAGRKNHCSLLKRTNQHFSFI
jgi:hypothetical protein